MLVLQEPIGDVLVHECIPEMCPYLVLLLSISSFLRLLLTSSAASKAALAALTVGLLRLIFKVFY